MSSQMYSRYVPPKKKQKISSPPIDLPERTIESAPAVKPSPEPIKQSKSKSQTTADKDNPAKRKRTDESNEQKPKKSKKKAEPDVEVANGDGDAIEEKRHKSLMEKREKSLRKAEKLAKKAAKAAKEAGSVEETIEEPIEVHSLGPLPQPEPIPEPAIQSITSSLPSWLASPIRVAPTVTASFSDIGIDTDIERALQKHGFQNAFAVQAAVLPLLLPGPSREGDVLVSASTGSGKTLSYVLPMIQSISQNRVSRLRGLIVMPTRELVTQAREVCNVCADVFASGDRKRIKIGTAVGSENFKSEQASLMGQELRYDPKAYSELETKLNAKWESSEHGSAGEEDVPLCDDEEISPLPDHVIGQVSKVDILICTPGRLVEHLKSTPGFTLEEVKWLVVDEADKLLDQSFQQWLGIVMGKLSRDVRKVILSATISRDVGQLSGLKLHRPRLVVLETPEEDGVAKEGHVLPSLLAESAMKVDDGASKPLYLLYLLQREGMASHASRHTKTLDSEESSDEDSDTSSDASFDSSSDSSSDGSSDGSSNSSSKSSTKGSTAGDTATKTTSAPLGTPRGVLIFTKSNETAVRLGRLIALLEPKYAELTGTLTSTTRSSARASTIASFNSNKLSILVASDLVSRGLDLPDLAHVVNYDIPTSVTNYVHRVGRTARAGRQGHAWTLFTDTEGRWFWNEIARSASIQRPSGSKVERVNVTPEQVDGGLRKRYEAALEELGREATGSKPDVSKQT
jgi:ATP-dependent RNA helicase DDX51/DBP6